jgi:hypothetical protein
MVAALSNVIEQSTYKTTTQHVIQNTSSRTEYMFVKQYI